MLAGKTVDGEAVYIDFALLGEEAPKEVTIKGRQDERSVQLNHAPAMTLFRSFVDHKELIRFDSLEAAKIATGSRPFEQIKCQCGNWHNLYPSQAALVRLVETRLTKTRAGKYLYSNL